MLKWAILNRGHTRPCAMHCSQSAHTEGRVSSSKNNGPPPAVPTDLGYCLMPSEKLFPIAIKESTCSVGLQQQLRDVCRAMKLRWRKWGGKPTGKFSCTTCVQEFPTQKGLKIHRTRNGRNCTFIQELRERIFKEVFSGPKIPCTSVDGNTGTTHNQNAGDGDEQSSSRSNVENGDWDEQSASRNDAEVGPTNTEMNPTALGRDGGAVRAEDEDDGKGPTDTSKNGDDKENVVCVDLTKDKKDDDVVCVCRPCRRPHIFWFVQQASTKAKNQTLWS